MFAGVDPYLSQRRSLRLTALDQPIAAVSGTTSIWVAARGLTSRPSTIQAPHAKRNGNQIKAGPLLEVLQRVAEVTEPQPATAIVFGGETPYSARVCDLFDQAFKARLSFVIANENPNYFSELASQFEASSVPISIQAVCSGLRALKPIGGSSESVELPSLEGGVVVVSTETVLDGLKKRPTSSTRTLDCISQQQTLMNQSQNCRTFLRGKPDLLACTKPRGSMCPRTNNSTPSTTTI